MATRIHALLVDDPKEPLAELERLLDRQGIRMTHARNCAEAAEVLHRPETLDLVFTNTALADGTWAQVETLAERVCPPVPVIVVSRDVNVPLYLDALERGAADFIVPPFQDADLDYVVRGALLHGVVAPSAPARVVEKRMSEVARDAQNHTDRTTHAQS